MLREATWGRVGTLASPLGTGQLRLGATVRNGRAFAEQPLVVHRKLAQVPEAAIEGDLRDRARPNCGGAQQMARALHAGRADIGHGRYAEYFPETVLERTCLRMGVPGQVGQPDRIGEVALDVLTRTLDCKSAVSAHLPVLVNRSFDGGERVYAHEQ